MIKNDKYNAVWLSHSSVSDFLKCKRLYFLRNIWKNKNNRKVNIVSPNLSLGLAVHQIIEPLANLKSEERFNQDLIEKFELNWKKFSGKNGGFLDGETEDYYKERGLNMIKNIINNKGPLVNKTIKYYDGDFIPNIYLSEEENIILCGLIDWVEYLDKTDTLRVIDFKTGKNEESEDSFQLPIYKILLENLQKRKVTNFSYWYLDKDKYPIDKNIEEEDVENIKDKLLNIGKEIKSLKTSKDLLILEKNFKCEYGGCKYCRDLELIRNYKEDNEYIEYIGCGEYNQDLYLIKK